MLQPMSTLQHLVAMTGGVIGALRHILHLNASETNLIKQGGRGRNLLTTISSCSIVLHSSKVELLFCSSSLSILVSSFISFTSCLTNLSAFFFLGAHFSLPNSSSELGSLSWYLLDAFAFAVSLSFMAKIFLLGHFQNFDPVLKWKNYVHKLYKLFTRVTRWWLSIAVKRKLVIVFNFIMPILSSSYIVTLLCYNLVIWALPYCPETLCMSWFYVLVFLLTL